ncbi:MAG: DUF3576 domain-containing protein [Pseudomonadota bacterium]
MMRVTPFVLASLLVAACGEDTREVSTDFAPPETTAEESSVFDLFANRDDPNVTLEVNRYIWTATLEVLSFMPVEAADPFSGLLVMGYGTPPGGNIAYRATVHVRDPSLDPRALNLAMSTRSGPVAADTLRTVENAILTRARQLRIAENSL